MLFTKDMTVGDLKVSLNHPSYSAVRDRMRAVILRRQGKSFRDIAKILARSLDFVKTWNDRFKAFGAPGLNTLPRLNEHATRLLTPEHKAYLRERVSAGPKERDQVSVFTRSSIRDIVREELGVKCGLTTISSTLHSLGFRKVKPRPVHEKNCAVAMKQWLDVELPFF